MTLRGHRHRYLRTAAAIASGVLAFPAAGRAADLPLKAPALKAVYDWTGLYIGAHAGVTRGTSSATLTDPTVAFPVVAPGATLISVSILQDEQGTSILDNIDVNGKFIGKPGRR